jgi:uncharacterized membrane protein
MSLRTARERVVQTLAYEAGGLAVATPIYAMVFQTDAMESAALLVALSVAVMIWSPTHNVLFDLVEWRFTRRVASDRPHYLRFVHAFSHEATALVVTLPVLVALGGLGLGEAILADIGLTIVYTLYAYVFHWLFDRLRPVRPAVSSFRGDQA